MHSHHVYLQRAAAEAAKPATSGKPKRGKTSSASAEDATEAAAAGQQFFLVKSEPNVFSIDDLAGKPDSTEAWDGERGAGIPAAWKPVGGWNRFRKWQ